MVDARHSSSEHDSESQETIAFNMHIHSLTKHSVGYGKNRSKAPPILSIYNGWT
jgi:hypothetical protein